MHCRTLKSVIARKKTRTSMLLTALVPETSVSTNSTIRAELIWVFYSYSKQRSTNRRFQGCFHHAGEGVLPLFGAGFFACYQTVGDC